MFAGDEDFLCSHAPVESSVATLLWSVWESARKAPGTAHRTVATALSQGIATDNFPRLRQTKNLSGEIGAKLRRRVPALKASRIEKIAIGFLKLAPRLGVAAGAPFVDHGEERHRDGFMVDLRMPRFGCERAQPARETHDRVAKRITRQHFIAEPNMLRMWKCRRIELAGFEGPEGIFH